MSHSGSVSAAGSVLRYRLRIDRSDIPDYVRPEVERQLRRLEAAKDKGIERTLIQAYLELMIRLPWRDRLQAEQRFASEPPPNPSAA